MIGYRIVRRFDREHDEGWPGFVEHGGLRGLAEVIGLDSSLCPVVEWEWDADDWDRLVWGEELGSAFSDWESLRRRHPPGPGEQALALQRDPRREPLETPVDESFVFKGYEVLDERCGISALVNGGFDRVIGPEDLTACGLVSSLEHARRIRRALRVEYPGEDHADCEVWAVWRWEGR